ncbi:MAG TPA: hypothetical protein VGF99_17785, partial [Myxococcota bacterium]
DDDQDVPSTALPALHELAALLRSMPDASPTAPLPKVAFVPTTSTTPRVLPQLAALSSTRSVKKPTTTT